ncbi:MAG: Alpha-mannosidase 2C1 [Stictis urceolatum]|nr:Alpha-mannosidase 2C1 [Stictis urceolata]
MGGETSSKLVAAESDYPKLVSRPVGKQIRSIYKGRINQFTDGGQYRENGLMGRMYEGRVSDDHVKLQYYSVPNLARPSFKEAMKAAEWKDTRKGTAFGPSWSTHWFKIKIAVPKELQKKEHLEFHWDAQNEGLIYTEKGEVVHGLTGGGERIEWILPEIYRDGKEHLFYIEMACNRMFGNADGDTIQPPNPNHYFPLNTADIVAVNLEARQLYIDYWIIGDAAREFPQDGWESHKATQICNRIMDTFIASGGSQESIKKGREIAREYIGDVNSHKVYDSGKEPIIYGIGHCHIDTCWLWPWDETKRKVARSWSNQCDLMDRYPEHKFTCSQAQQYKWLETLYPSLFDRVKQKVKEGRFNPIGGSWVEHDTNMPSGESLVRQFLYGQRFFESHFGERCKTFWLPDTFGYSTQLPQLCRLAGMERFFTQKLSWNNINNFPHTTFNWVSLDGSQVLCHMTPAETYTASAHFGDVKRSVTQHKSMDEDNTSLLVFGKGDGGGGPTWEHLEKLRRCRGVSDNTGLLPRVEVGHTVEDFFDQLQEKAANGTDFVTWYGELYFELHRGTYTTQANNKWNNRKTEILMHDLEMLSTLATIKDSSYKYPKKEIDDMWEGILLCQFHDCLPGSSIEMCYDDSDKIYAGVFKSGEKLIKKALDALGFDEHAPGSPAYGLNLLPWEREEVVKVARKGKSEKTTVMRGDQGIAQEQETESRVSLHETSSGVYVISNDDLRVRIDRGIITSIYDKNEEREVIREGEKAHQFVIFDDKPLYWQAWDVEVFHLQSREELSGGKTTIGEDGPHRVSIKTEFQISEQSWLKTEIGLSSSIKGQPTTIEMKTEVEWHEDKKFLKVEFPVDIVNTEASYETQYGIIRRPTHYNTTWDMAKFEVCCHKWADLSENGYGVSILNDSKYGFATCGNMMRLSLLRAPKAPDAHADMGHHTIKYAILPHAGPLDSRTVRAAYNFNHPMRVLTADENTSSAIFKAVTLTGSKSLILDAIKRGEDDEDVSRGELPKRKGRSVIVRVYDSLGGMSRGAIKWNEDLLDVKKVYATNILEDDGEEVKFKGGEAAIKLRPFEVATFRLQL